MKADIVIVGAGIAGISAALQLNRINRSFIVLERQIHPRGKPCGGGLSGRSIRFLEDLGFDYPYHNVKVLDMNLYGEFKSRFFRAQGIIRTVERERFDYLFMQFARDKGVRVAEDTHIQSMSYADGLFRIETNIGTIHARAVIGADGANSLVRRTLQRKAWRNSYAVVVDGIKNKLGLDSAIFEFGYVANGYAWAFPVADRLNIGIYSLDKIPKAKMHLDRFTQHLGLKVDLDPYKISGRRIPYGGLRPGIEKRPVILVGDAGGYGDPITGEGINNALLSGKFAAMAFGMSIEHSNFCYNLVAARLNVDRLFSRIFCPIHYNHLRRSLRGIRKGYVYRMLLEGQANGADYIKSILCSPYYVIQSIRGRRIGSRFID